MQLVGLVLSVVLFGWQWEAKIEIDLYIRFRLVERFSRGFRICIYGYCEYRIRGSYLVSVWFNMNTALHKQTCV